MAAVGGFLPRLCYTLKSLGTVFSFSRGLRGHARTSLRLVSYNTQARDGAANQNRNDKPMVSGCRQYDGCGDDGTNPNDALGDKLYSFVSRFRVRVHNVSLHRMRVAPPTSEWNVVVRHVARRRRNLTLSLWWRGAARGSGRSGFVALMLASTGRGGPSGATAQELQVLTHYLHATPLLATGLVFPSVHTKAALDVNRTAFLGILTGYLGEASPEFDINKCRLLAFLTVVEGVIAVDGQANVRNGAAFRGKLDFGVACDVSDEDDFVDVGHGFLIGLGCGWNRSFFSRQLDVVLEENVVVELEL